MYESALRNLHFDAFGYHITAVQSTTVTEFSTAMYVKFLSFIPLNKVCTMIIQNEHTIRHARGKYRTSSLAMHQGRRS